MIPWQIALAHLVVHDEAPRRQDDPTMGFDVSQPIVLFDRKTYNAT